METTLRIRSSSSDTVYTLQVLCEDGSVAIFCDCSAGAYGKLCKHKLAIVANDKTDLESQDQDRNFELAQEWIKGSTLQATLADIRAVEKEVEGAQAKLKKLKKTLEMQLNSKIVQKG
jgi:uncharacterized Zn finger protein